ncbi:MAG: HAMP domain-containing sensor histidine kinase, partial [Patescibacteria group bacterium]
KMFRAAGIEKKQLKIILAGTIISYVLIIAFNLILPVVFQDTRFIPLVPIFLFPSLAFTAYAIIKHQLFNVKVIATELLVFTIWIIILIELLTKTSWGERILEGFIFFFMVIFGVLLIRSVRQEVSKRLQFELLSKELAVANDKLKELDDLKTDFISIASHQLRTPLTAIKGYSSMIMEGTYGESPVKIKGAVDRIFQSAQRLIYIVNDLLDISRIEQGKFTLTLEDVKVANVLRDVVEELKPNAQKNNLDVSFIVSVEDAEIKIKADFGKIRQVFLNLIDNAIKYTPSGFVKVELKNNGGNTLISISDSGVGMSDVTLRNLFQKFSRAKGIAKMHTDGSGLGLYVAKQIIGAHHGRVWAESDGEGRGSRFFVELPISGFQN